MNIASRNPKSMKLAKSNYFSWFATILLNVKYVIYLTEWYWLFEMNFQLRTMTNELANILIFIHIAFNNDFVWLEKSNVMNKCSKFTSIIWISMIALILDIYIWYWIDIYLHIKSYLSEQSYHFQYICNRTVLIIKF